MMDFTLLAGFVFTVFLIELTPGPNMAWLVMLSLSDGRKAGLAATAGIAAGLIVIAGLSALGLAALIASSPVLYEILRWAGALFLLYLAYEGWRSTGESSTAIIPGQTARHVLRGFIVNALNPKAAFFYVTVMPEFISPSYSADVQAISLALISVAIATAIHLGLVVSASRLRPVIMNADWNTRIRRILSLSLVGVAIWLFLSSGR